MLQGLTTHISDALQLAHAQLPLNPQSASQIQTKIAMLQNASLAGDIMTARRWDETTAASANGRAISVDSVYPLESMRADGSDAIRVLQPVVPVLENFYAMPLPVPIVRVWYSFRVGNHEDFDGTLDVEDRATYESRHQPLPYDAILMHELGHTYMGHESLNQFIQVYAYNVIHAGSTDLTAWTYTREWVPGLASNTGIAALLDVYQLVGLDTMQPRIARSIRCTRPTAR
jgi:hypothetical protein